MKLDPKADTKAVSCGVKKDLLGEQNHTELKGDGRGEWLVICGGVERLEVGWKLLLQARWEMDPVLAGSRAVCEHNVLDSQEISINFLNIIKKNKHTKLKKNLKRPRVQHH